LEQPSFQSQKISVSYYYQWECLIDCMVSKKSLLALGIVVLLVAGSVGGYANTALQESPDEETPSEETIEERALNNNTTVDSVTGTVVMKIDTGEKTKSMKAKVWQEPPKESRFKYVSGPQEGTVMVSNGSTITLYNESSNTVRRLQLSEGKKGTLQQLAKMFQNLSSQYTAEYNGQATVSGRETYVVSVQPPEDGPLADAVKNQTVWLDQENWFPIKQKTSMQIGNRTITQTITYTNISYNVSIPDEKFTFEPPENATVKTIDFPDAKAYSSIEKAENAVNISIHEPDVPDEFSIKSVSVTKANNETIVSVIYQSGSDTLVFTQSTADRRMMGGEDVSIGSLTGSYQTLNEMGNLQWSDNEFSYSITGNLSKSSLVDIAESLYC
jgi:outer membrane lipoprotein-sorting protein